MPQTSARPQPHAPLAQQMGARRFGRMNLLGLKTLAQREIMRFVSVWQQTLGAPLVTAGLFLGVFSLAFGQNRAPVMGVEFIEFLVPGILMMSVVQNAFANTSSSIVSAKVMGNIVDTLMPPLSPLELVLGYLAGSIARGFLVATSILIAVGVFMGQWPAHPLWLGLSVLLGTGMLGALGIIAGILAQKFDQIAAITNFIVTPLSFLSGTFYSVAVLPPFMALLSHVNPVFYLIDMTRFAYIDASDSSPVLGAIVCFGTTLALIALAWSWFKRGYRLKP